MAEIEMLNVVETMIVSDYFEPITFWKFSEFLEVRQDPLYLGLSLKSGLPMNYVSDITRSYQGPAFWADRWVFWLLHRLIKNKVLLARNCPVLPDISDLGNSPRNLRL